MEDNYNDIINIKHYEPKNHKRMSNYQRAAQFAPFAALTGYDEIVKETGRTTDKKIELSEEEQQELNNKINEIIYENKKEVTITYFVKDKTKQGGKYLTEEKEIKEINNIGKYIKFKDNTIIPLEDVLNII